MRKMRFFRFVSSKIIVESPITHKQALNLQLQRESRVLKRGERDRAHETANRESQFPIVSRSETNEKFASQQKPCRRLRLLR